MVHVYNAVLLIDKTVTQLVRVKISQCSTMDRTYIDRTCTGPRVDCILRHWSMNSPTWRAVCMLRSIGIGTSHPISDSFLQRANKTVASTTKRCILTAYYYNHCFAHSSVSSIRSVPALIIVAGPVRCILSAPRERHLLV